MNAGMTTASQGLKSLNDSQIEMSAGRMSSITPTETAPVLNFTQTNMSFAERTIMNQMKQKPRDFNLPQKTVLNDLGAASYDKMDVDIQMMKLNIE